MGGWVGGLVGGFPLVDLPLLLRRPLPVVDAVPGRAAWKNAADEEKVEDRTTKVVPKARWKARVILCVAVLWCVWCVWVGG